MFVQIEALYLAPTEIDYENLGIEPPEDILEYKPLWINVATVCYFEPGKHPGETILVMANGQNLLINMSNENFLLLLDQVKAIPDVDFKITA